MKKLFFLLLVSVFTLGTVASAQQQNLVNQAGNNCPCKSTCPYKGNCPNKGNGACQYGQGYRGGDNAQRGFCRRQQLQQQQLQQQQRRQQQQPPSPPQQSQGKS